MIFRRLAFLLVFVALLGCNNEKNRNLIDHRTDQAVKMSEDAQSPAPKKSYNPLMVSDKVWTGNSAKRLHHGMPLPSKYEAPRGATLITSDPISLQDIISAISMQTDIPIRIAPGQNSAPAIGGTTSGKSDETMSLAYEGPLSGLLNLVSGNFGVNWKYDGTTIAISRYETRVFMIESLPGTQSIKDGIKEDNNSSSSSSSSSTTAGGSFSASSGSSLQQSSEMSVELKVWDELAQTITAILNGVGSVVVSPSSGTATVTTTPDIMQTVAQFIAEENKRLSHHIAINVEIYSVALQDGADFNIAFSSALTYLREAGANVTGVTGPASSASNLGNLSVAILNPTTTSTGTTGTITSIFSALSTVGDTTRVTQFPLTTLNNRTVSRRIGRDKTYVASLSNSSSTTSSYSSSTVTPGTIREGFSLQLTPRLLDDGRIMMQYSLSLVDIVNMTSFDTGAGNIQLPETSSRVFVQQTMLKSGSTLIIGGYDDESASQSSSGMGNPYNYFMGGGSTNSKTRTMMFIAITPQVLDMTTAGQE